MIPIHNTRSPQQWEIISKHIDFDGLDVVDYGCGYADILVRCALAGARYCLGVEHDPAIVRIVRRNLKGIGAILVVPADIRMASEDIKHYDVSICFSVLPYVDNPGFVLSQMKKVSDIALVEAQYQKDGPGSNWYVKNDADMEVVLLKHWNSVEAIGKTLVDDHNLYRTIWKCENK